MDTRTLLESLFFVVSLVGGAITIHTYLRNSSLKRAEWLSNLHERFHEQSHYRRIRVALDYGNEDLETLRSRVAEVHSGKSWHDIESQDEQRLFDRYFAYLNFFEFVACLWRLGQLSLREVTMSFEWYVRHLATFDFVLDTIKTDGFENLYALLIKLGCVRQDDPRENHR